MVTMRSDNATAVLPRGVLALALVAVVGGSPISAAPARAGGLLQVETTVEGPYGGEETTVEGPRGVETTAVGREGGVETTAVGPAGREVTTVEGPAGREETTVERQ
jgi:hypothetical protein